MKLLEHARKKVAGWPYGGVSVLAALAAFGCYTSMYAFRKAISAATFEGQQELWQVDYKVWLVIAQVIGYTISKFYGIRFVSELVSRRRRSEEHTFELQSLMRISYAVFCLKKKKI